MVFSSQDLGVIHQTNTLIPAVHNLTRFIMDEAGRVYASLRQWLDQ
ncbi:protein of unknown function [Moritella yayanosii]|uniref:Uncharacterized protein n=1 Tax=Moritella yayanosii TaxID=69539 RepID=A0A330LP85_9GAMM|nr:protein of unknown function [Moritella yayanosii]